MPDSTHIPVILLAFASDRDDTVNYLRNLPEEDRQNREPLQRARTDGLCELVNATANHTFWVYQDPECRDRIAVFHFGGQVGTWGQPTFHVAYREQRLVSANDVSHGNV